MITHQGMSLCTGVNDLMQSLVRHLSSNVDPEKVTISVNRLGDLSEVVAVCTGTAQDTEKVILMVDAFMAGYNAAIKKEEAKNVAFTYMYRDHSNYKNIGRVVLTNPNNQDLQLIAQAITAACHNGAYFIARQVDVPELFNDAGTDDGAHCWHEFLGLEATSDLPNDNKARTRVEFVAQFTATQWQEYNRAEEEEAV